MAVTRKSTRRSKPSPATSRPSRKLNPKTPARSAPIRPSKKASQILDAVGEAVSQAQVLATKTQEQFTAWSSHPPTTGNRRTRFANTLEKWANESADIAKVLERAEKIEAQLPKAVACAPDERAAKIILKGLRAADTIRLMREFSLTARSLANRARKPLTPEDADKVWADASDFVKHLGQVADDLREIGALIKAMRDRFRDPSKGIDTSSDMLLPGTPSVDHLEEMIEKLLGMMQFASQELSQSGTRGRNCTTIAEQLEAAMFAVSRYDVQCELFRTSIKADSDLAELLKPGSTNPFSPIAAKINAVIETATLKGQWCRGWLNFVISRFDAACELPAEMPIRLAKGVHDLHAVIKIAKQWRGDGVAGSSLVKPVVYEPSRFPEDSIKVLRALLEDPPTSSSVHTIKSLSKATGIGDQKIRRTLLKVLGPKGARFVVVTKQSRRAGKFSPPDTYAIPTTLIEVVRDLLTKR